MIVDASATVAILLGEPEAEYFDSKIIASASCRMSIVNYIEVAMVLEGRLSSEGGHLLDEYLETAQITLAPVTLRQAELVRDAWRRFGRGNHPAALNLGDCFAYALAADAGEPLLFKGDDFSLTDIIPA